MAKVKVIGKSMFITSAVKLEDFERVSKFSPETLILNDKDGNQYFSVGTGKSEICKYGVRFGEKNSEGMALARIDVDIASKEALAEEYAGVVANLTTVEEAVKTKAQAITENINKFAEEIEVG